MSVANGLNNGERSIVTSPSTRWARAPSQVNAWGAAALTLHARIPCLVEVLVMKLSALMFSMAALLAGSAYAQTPAPATAPATTSGAVHAVCKDGTPYSGATLKGACRGHGGVDKKASAADAAPAASAPAAAAAPAPAKPAAPMAPAHAHARCNRAHGTCRHRCPRRWRRQGLGQRRHQGLPLSRRPLLRQDQAGLVHERSRCQGAGHAPQPRQGLRQVSAHRPGDRPGRCPAPRPAMPRGAARFPP